MGDRMFLGGPGRGRRARARDNGPAAVRPSPRSDGRQDRLRRGRGAARARHRRAADDRELASDDHPDVSWGLPRLHRRRGDGQAPGVLVVARRRADRRRARRRPARPHLAHRRARRSRAPPRAVRYPAAGTDNSIVTLSVFDMQGDRVDIGWDVEAFPYLVTVEWNATRTADVVVESRDQKTWQILSADPVTGGSDARPRRPRRSLAPTSCSVFRVPGRRPPGATLDSEDTRRLTFDDVAGDAGRSPGGGGHRDRRRPCAVPRDG